MIPNLNFTIEVMIETYQQESGGKRPAGLLLGPSEYRELCNQAKRSPDYLKEASVGNEAMVTEYKGFPVYVKELPGIELMINYQEAFSNAYR